MHAISAIFLISLVAWLSSRSPYVNTVLCRLWVLASGMWIAFSCYASNSHGHVEWELVILPPIGVMLMFAALHWVFSGLNEWAAWRRELTQRGRPTR